MKRLKKLQREAFRLALREMKDDKEFCRLSNLKQLQKDCASMNAVDCRQTIACFKLQ